MAGGASGLHGGDAAARSTLFPQRLLVPLRPLLLLLLLRGDSPPDRRFDRGDGAEMRVNAPSGGIGQATSSTSSITISTHSRTHTHTR